MTITTGNTGNMLVKEGIAFAILEIRKIGLLGLRAFAWDGQPLEVALIWTEIFLIAEPMLSPESSIASLIKFRVTLSLSCLYIVGAPSYRLPKWWHTPHYPKSVQARCPEFLGTVLFVPFGTELSCISFICFASIVILAPFQDSLFLF